jgi:hypothetical protein
LRYDLNDTFYAPAQYFVTVEVTNAAGEIARRTSSGVIVDVTPPYVASPLIHLVPGLSDRETKYQSHTDRLSFQWLFEDDESSIQLYRFCVSDTNLTTPCNVVPWNYTRQNERGELITTQHITAALQQGKRYFVTVYGENRAGIGKSVTSTGVIVDNTPPVAGTIGFGKMNVTTRVFSNGGSAKVLSTSDYLEITWDGFVDLESGVPQYAMSLGTEEGAANVLPWAVVGVAGSSRAYVSGHVLQVDGLAAAAADRNVTLDVLRDSPFRLLNGVRYFVNMRAFSGTIGYTEVSQSFFILERDEYIELSSAAVEHTSRDIFEGVEPSRRRRDLTSKAAYVSLPANGLAPGDSLVISPLTDERANVSYTTNDNPQIDPVLFQSYTDALSQAYTANPYLAANTSRFRASYAGMTFTITVLSVNGGSVLKPLTLIGSLPVTWHWGQQKPSWFFYDEGSETWKPAARTCAHNGVDSYSSLTGITNVTSLLCDPDTPALPPCPSTTTCFATNPAAVSAGTGTPCVFPFEYKGVNYTSCTTVDGVGGQPWCATASVFSDSQWGVCKPGTGVTETKATSSGKTCIFPVVHNGVTYTSCIPGVRDWCFSNKTTGEWGFCQCDTLANDPLACSDTPAAALRGPSHFVQVALFYLDTLSDCASKPVAYNVSATPVPQAYGSPIVAQANATDPENDRLRFQVLQLPSYGQLLNQTEFEQTGLARFQINSNIIGYFSGTDKIMYRAVETGVTFDGQASLCTRAMSDPALITFTITDLNDSPVIALNLTDQPDARLRAFSTSLSTTFFDLDIDEDSSFTFHVLSQVRGGGGGKNRALE